MQVAERRRSSKIMKRPCIRKTPVLEIPAWQLNYSISYCMQCYFCEVRISMFIVTIWTLLSKLGKTASCYRDFGTGYDAVRFLAAGDENSCTITQCIIMEIRRAFVPIRVICRLPISKCTSRPPLAFRLSLISWRRYGMRDLKCYNIATFNSNY